MTGQEAFLAGHCPLIGRYFEPCASRTFHYFEKMAGINNSGKSKQSVDFRNIRRISTFRTKALRLELLDEGPSLETSKFSLYFRGSCIPTNESLFILLALPALAQTVHDVNFRGYHACLLYIRKCCSKYISFQCNV